MTQRARPSSGYMWRLVILTLACGGFTIFCLKDGLWTYPRQRQMALKFAEFRDEGQLEAWPAYAADQGWPQEDPGRPRDQSDIIIQFVMAALTAPFAISFGVSLLRMVGRWIELHEDRIVTSSGQQVRLDAITSIDKSRWDHKGIAVVHYQDDGIDQTLVLDDFKFERPAIDAMVEKIDDVLKARSQPAVS